MKYPQGAEKMLITRPAGTRGALRGPALGRRCGERQRRYHGRDRPPAAPRPRHPGAGDYHRRAGDRKKGNYRIPIGTPLRFALEYAGLDEHCSRVFLGGPMMGQALPSLDIPITKGTSGFIAFTEQQTAAPAEYPCIHCAYCVDACPLFLNPSQLGLLAKSGQYERMADEYNLMDCFECGSCSYVCPAHIPLVQRFRAAKALLRKRRAAMSERGAHPGNPHLAAHRQRRQCRCHHAQRGVGPAAGGRVRGLLLRPGGAADLLVAVLSCVPPSICCAGSPLRPLPCGTGR